ncbi:MAG: glucose 1-dehydrogenase [Chloroflexota bacterium]
MSILENKHVIVTGGGHGIGRAYSRHCAAEGASVVVADIDLSAAEHVAGEIESAGGRALPVRVDVADRTSAAAMVGQAVSRFGEVDGIVNNAAVFATIPISRVGFEEIDEDEWDLVFNVNTKGVWQCCRAVVPSMRKAGGGSIVNISSASIWNGRGMRAHYVASKAAVVGITRTLARELGDDNIRVNAVTPGNTLSEVNPTPETLKMREDAIALRAIKRMQRPTDLVGTIAFLLSDAASFITGQTINVDGGTNFP